MLRVHLPSVAGTPSTTPDFAVATLAVTKAAADPSTSWRLTVLDEVKGLATVIDREYRTARGHQRKYAWEARFARLATAGSASVGAVIAVVGSANATGFLRWALVVLGVGFALVGSIAGTNSYVRNRSLSLRYLRLLHDLPDYALLVLPSTTAPEAYAQLDAFRALWESAGT